MASTAGTNESSNNWSIRQQKRDTARLGTVLYTACEAFRIANVLFPPIIPEKAEVAFGVFGEEVARPTSGTNTDLSIMEWGRLAAGTKLSPVESLFPRIDQKKEKRMKKAPSKEKKIDIDTFVIYTDNETWAGRIHPFEALNAYRQQTGISARQVVVGMTATRFTIADPSDPGSLDIVGFDTATPNLISDFSRGDI